MMELLIIIGKVLKKKIDHDYFFTKVLIFHNIWSMIVKGFSIPLVLHTFFKFLIMVY